MCLFPDKGARRKYTRSRVIVEGIDNHLMDMVDIDKRNDDFKFVLVAIDSFIDIDKRNDDFKFVLVAIDIFFRFAHCHSVKSKKGVDVVKTLQSKTGIEGIL